MLKAGFLGYISNECQYLTLDSEPPISKPTPSFTLSNSSMFSLEDFPIYFQQRWLWSVSPALESFRTKQFVSIFLIIRLSLRNPTEYKLDTKFNSWWDSSHFNRWKRISRFISSANFCLFRICLDFQQQTVFKTTSAEKWELFRLSSLCASIQE